MLRCVPTDPSDELVGVVQVQQEADEVCVDLFGEVFSRGTVSEARQVSEEREGGRTHRRFVLDTVDKRR